MKLINKICGISLVAFLIMLAAPNISKAQDEGGYVSDQEFYDNLSPYGTWVDDAQYGNVWVPDAEDGFRPYGSRGHWVVTDYGNTWVSDYPWGWATFHYGRWRYDDYYGWEWIPGHEWAPAWVSWRSGGGYYGWAPMQPGISINVSFGSGYNVPDYYWVCAPQAYINRPNIYNYYVPHTRVVNIIHRTTIIHNTYVYNKRTYVTGPRITEIRRVTRDKNVKVYKVGNASRPSGGGRVVNNTVNIYRPQIKKSSDARPARVVNAAEYKKANPTGSIAARASARGTVNRSNATKLAEVSKTDNNKFVKVNTSRSTQPAAKPGQPNGVRPAQTGGRVTPTNPQQNKQQATEQARQKREQQHTQAKQQRDQQTTTQQKAAQKQQQDQARQQRSQQATQQKQQEASQQRNQQATQQRQQQEAQKQQEASQQRNQQAAQQRQQQEAQKQQQASQQRNQQAAQQRQQQQEAQKQQQAQRQQQQQQQAQRQQQAQQQQQRSQQQQQQQAQRAQQQQQQQQKRQARPEHNR